MAEKRRPKLTAQQRDARVKAVLAATNKVKAKTSINFTRSVRGR